MLCYRLTKSRYAPLDAAGAIIYGGRWNSKGVPALYFGSSAAACILESRVHTPLLDRIQRLMHTIELPDGSVATMQDLGLSLPADWDVKPEPPSTTSLGDGWIASRASLGLYVPSVPSPMDLNILVNPAHPDFPKVRVVASEPHTFDPRLYPVPTRNKKKAKRT